MKLKAFVQSRIRVGRKSRKSFSGNHFSVKLINHLGAARASNPHGHDIAIDEAYTAAGFGIPTSAWSSALESHSAAARESLPRRPRMVCFGGGLPIRYEGKLVGGIGVSGGSEDEDEGCARAGLAAIGLAGWQALLDRARRRK